MQIIHMSITYYDHSQTKLREGNVFTPLCDSVHGGVRGKVGGGMLIKGGMHGKGGACMVKGGTCMQERRPLKRAVRQYASYWNAFLLLLLLLIRR